MYPQYYVLSKIKIFEYIALQNDIETSYYIQRMMEHVFSLNINNQFKYEYEFWP